MPRTSARPGISQVAGDTQVSKSKLLKSRWALKGPRYSDLTLPHKSGYDSVAVQPSRG